MTQTYFNPEREDDLYSLPDCEIFYLDTEEMQDEMGEYYSPGWYWWACFPGCLPNGDPNGPFDTEDQARMDAQDF